MKLILILSALFSFNSFALTEAHCRLVDGIYKNSQTQISDMRFETLVDIFTLKNANVITMNLAGEELRFIRSDMEVKKYTRLIFLLRKNGTPVRAIHMMIDRTPKEVSDEREFYGNMIVSSETDFKSVISTKNLTYNFHCTF